MARKSPLRAVTANEKAPKPKTLVEAVESGTYTEIREAQARDIARSLGSPEIVGKPAEAALHRQLALITAELRQLRKSDEQEASEDAADVEDGEFDASAV